jgi:hypothetical protein
MKKLKHEGKTYQKTICWGNRKLQIVEPSKKVYKRNPKHKKPPET